MNAPKNSDFLGHFELFGKWLANKWRNWGESILFDSRSKWTDFINKEGVRKIWESYLTGKIDHSTRLFMLLVLAIWLESSL